MGKKKSTAKTAAKEEPLEKQLWKAADKLRKNIDGRDLGHLINRRTCELSSKDIDDIATLKAELNEAIAENLAKVQVPGKKEGRK